MEEPLPDDRTKELYEDFLTDIGKRSDWEEQYEENDRLRHKGRKGKVVRHYPGAPNYVEPLIDDNVRDLTSQQINILYDSSARLVTVLPLTAEGNAAKADIELAFDTQLRILQNTRSLTATLLDRKNLHGASIAAIVEDNHSWYELFGERKTLPAFEPIDPRDLIVPTNTRRLKEADRLAYITRYTVRQFKDTARSSGWDEAAVKAIVKDRKRRITEGTGFNKSDVSAGQPVRIGVATLDPSIDEIIVWWAYYYDDSGKRRRKVFSPDMAEDKHVLAEINWVWTDDGTDRPWPFEQMRAEDVSQSYYDSRGIGELIADDQEMASKWMNLTATQADFGVLPMYEGPTQGMANFRMKPGARMPEGVSLAQRAPIDPSLNFNADQHRHLASRRAGSGQAALSNLQRTGEKKTATEVQATTSQSGMINSDAVSRFAEPFSRIFNQMWQFLRHNPVDLPMYKNDQFTGSLGLEVFKLPILVRATPHMTAINPLATLQQLMVLQPYLLNNPFIKNDQLTRKILDLINPYITDELVVDPSQAGPEGQPALDAQMGQVDQRLLQFEQALTQVFGKIDDMGKFMQSIAEQEQADAEEQANMEQARRAELVA